uniref:Uncharacterized protein LOC114344255 isoform X2 n=1 Tax=Diabrotica virgifera virgifera TaxID=50390 RepID=A0A6P7GLW6_DIAVI
MKSASIIIACVLFTEVFTSPTKRQTNNKNVSPGAIDSNYPSNSDNIYQTSNGPNVFPQANNSPDPFPEINNNPSQFNSLLQTNNGLSPFAQMTNAPSSLPRIPPLPVTRSENTESEPDLPVTIWSHPIIQTTPIPTAAIASLIGGNFG